MKCLWPIFLEVIFVVATILALPLASWAVDGQRKTHSQSIEPIDKRVSDLDPMKVNDLEDKVANAFRRGDCATILKTVPAESFLKVSPQLLAVIAYCMPPNKDPERMFLYAEEQAPDDEHIMLLHARYRWRKQIPTAEELWKRIVETAKDSRIRDLAQQYLNGEGSIAEEEQSKRTLLTFAIQTRGGYENNPESKSNSDPASKSLYSGFMSEQGAMTFSKETGFGAWGVNYAINEMNYFKTSDVDQLNQDLEVPFVFISGPQSKLIISMNGSYTFLSRLPFYSSFGGGLSQVLTWPDYEQTVKVSSYEDFYFPLEYQAQQGTHYRIDYRGELTSLFLKPEFHIYGDHTASAEDRSAGQVIPYSHWDYGFELEFKYSGTSWSGFLSPSYLLREDDTTTLDSTDPNARYTAKRRQDRTTLVEAGVYFKISEDLLIGPNYLFTEVVSNMGYRNYADLNYQDQVISLVLRTSYSN